jgi:MOSC domain-containing protein YiiM
MNERDATIRPGDGSVVSVQVGRVAPLGQKGVPSAFVKNTVGGPVRAEQLGLVGDEQADRRVHGGPDKAIYCYPVEHYAAWTQDEPKHAALFLPGGFGENLTLQGISEDQICIGDVLHIGGARVQVTQPRQPCFKLGLRFEDPQMLRAMLQSGRSGWYVRVLNPGAIEAGSPIAILERLNSLWSIRRFNRVLNNRQGTRDEIAELAELPGLSDELRESARAALSRDRVRQ